ncbi:hypothetical protein ACGF1Z_21605 [Streptomyces sp. NPDC048018]|uniref:hypothetical protein n=1 Tax=Streptomyces sp. NPDC048018 TaxID=3365499 RepID=UPI00371EEE23
MSSEGYFICGQARWDSEGIGSTVSSLEGPLGDIGAVWVFCEPDMESDTWATVLPKLHQKRFFAWSAKLRPVNWEPPGESVDGHSILWRSGKRAATHQFQGLPCFESRYQSLPNTEPTVRDFISNLAIRSSEFACAVGGSDASNSAWLRSALLMETHWSLSRDFRNSKDLESRRRRIISLYLRFSVEAGFFPAIPLNKHPYAGFVLFCPSVVYTDVLRSMARDVTAFEGTEATTRINSFLGRGGDLAYL